MGIEVRQELYVDDELVTEHVVRSNTALRATHVWDESQRALVEFERLYNDKVLEPPF
jgi:hypothetical protein